jgi:sec-independent protein translocase protein TatA
MGTLGTTEVILIVVVLLVLFGGSQLPKIARALGRTRKAFRAGTTETTGIKKQSED